MATDTSDLRGKLAKRSEEQLDKTGAAAPPTIKDLIDRQRSEIARALPKHMDPDRLARIAMTTIKSTPKLLECTSQSLLGALMLSAQTGLEPGPLGHVYFVPRWNKNVGATECQWMLGYKGIIELARRSGQLESIVAREVCEADEFDFSYGLDERLVHRPHMTGPRGAVVAFYGIARFKDGGRHVHVMSRDEVDQARQRSDAGKNGKGPWASDYEAMGRKTVIRRMMPFLPLSAEQANVITHDESVSTSLTVRPEDEPAEIGWLDAESWEGDDEQPGTSEEPSPETGEAMTTNQSRALHALLKAKHGAAGADRFPVLSAMLGREITSTNEVTKAEAGDVIDALREQPDQQAEGTT